MFEVNLNGKWRMKRTDETEWLDAAVPGSVYADLLNAGKMEDPFFRDNEKAALKLSDFDYEYRRTFSVDEASLAHDRIFLMFEGLDTLCDVYLNGEKILHADNMHRAWEVDVKKLLIPGENELRTVFFSPTRFIAERWKEEPIYDTDGDVTVMGFSYLRKAHCMFGWDWGPKLPDMGIWRPVSLRAYDRARLSDLLITQEHKSGRVSLKIRAKAEEWHDGLFAVNIRVTAPDGGVLEREIPVENGLAEAELEIENPQLWWPNGLGKHPLYTVKAQLLCGGRNLDEKSQRVGLRTLTVRQEKDKYGESFAFTVNGVPFFGMGADYIPEDNILSRCSRARTAKLIASCVEAHFNMVRVWGGGYYPDDYFYDLCDENGLVVWQDLMYACAIYNLTDDFRDNIAAETKQVVRRLRGHACLGLWCGNNELESGWTGWGWEKQNSPRRKVDYVKMFEVLLPKIVRENDPVTFWWPSSPCSGGCFDDPDGQSRGDMHYWEVWHGRKPFTDYRNVFPRFMSEFGLQSFPCLKTVESFTLPEDRNIFSHVMESHQKSGTGNEKIMYYISQYFRYPKDFGSLLYVSQLIQAEGIRYGVEHWRRNRGRCMGTIFWQLNDCWPVASWASIDSFGRWKALHYAAKRFFSPVLLSACEEGVKASLHVSNETRNDVSGEALWALTTARGEVVASGRIPVQAPAFSSREIAQLDFAKELDTDEKRRELYLQFRFVSGGKILSSGTVYFEPAKHFALEDPRISSEVREADGGFCVTLRAASLARFTELSLTDTDAVFSDNDFDLNAGEEREIFVRNEDLSRRMTLAEFRGALSVRSLYDSYEHIV